MKKVNKKKGFTLAELLVVIAILAILVAIAVPVFTGVLDEANDTVEAANLHAAQSAAMVEYLTGNMTGAQKWTYSVDPDTKNIVLSGPTAAAAGDTSASTDTTTGTVVVSIG